MATVQALPSTAEIKTSVDAALENLNASLRELNRDVGNTSHDLSFFLF